MHPGQPGQPCGEFCILTETPETCPMFSPDQLRMLQHLYLQYGPCIPLSAVHMYQHPQQQPFDAAAHVAQELVQWHTRLNVQETKSTQPDCCPFQSQHIQVIPDILGLPGLSLDIMSQAQAIILPTFQNPYPAHVI